MTDHPSSINISPQRPLTEAQIRSLERHERIDPDMLRILDQKTPAEKLQIANGMWRSARDIIRNLLRAEHPDWTEEEVSQETARRLSHGAS